MNLYKMTLVCTLFFCAAIAEAKKDKFLCGQSAIELSDCLIRAALDDAKVSYKNPGGGGISEIKQRATHTYSIAYLQEEKIDILVYEFQAHSKGMYSLLKRTHETQSARLER